VKRAWALLCVAACDPVWSLDARVESEAGDPLENATLVLTECPKQNTHDLGTLAQLTDTDGQASAGGLGWCYPPCRVTIAKPGFQSVQFTFDEMCDGDRDDCDRVQSRTFVLVSE
jgi:hypothetical protein